MMVQVIIWPEGKLSSNMTSQGRLMTIERCIMVTALVMTKLFTVFLIQMEQYYSYETYTSSYEGQLESYGTAVWQLDNNGNIKCNRRKQL